MRYRIEYAGNRKSTIVNGRPALLKELKKPAIVTDIRKIYKSGITDSVIEKYQNYVTAMVHHGRNQKALTEAAPSARAK